MENKIIIDIIIVSYAHNEVLQSMTKNCINSLLASENSAKIDFKPIVIESQTALKDYQYPDSKTIYPTASFGFHRYMNLGIEMTCSPYVCLCNNDLIFHDNWASEILNAFSENPEICSASPICPIYHPTVGCFLNSGIKMGYNVGSEIAGWCLFIKRDALNLVGKLDENFMFNAADLDYASTLEALGLGHALVTSSIVEHLRSKTLDTQNDEQQDELNLGKSYYDIKWGHRLLIWKQLEA